MALTGWTEGTFTADGRTRPTWTRGTGPGVVVIHEIPGITPAVQRFAERVVDAGFTVTMPLLVGEAGREPSGRYLASSFAKVCVSREFTSMATGSTSPVISWLRALAASLHASAGGPGVGAVGRRAEAGCQVLGLRYTGDKLVGSRFDSLRELLGDRFVAVEFLSTSRSDHSVLTEQPQETGIEAVLDFLRSRLLV